MECEPHAIIVLCTDCVQHRHRRFDAYVAFCQNFHWCSILIHCGSK